MEKKIVTSLRKTSVQETSLSVFSKSFLFLALKMLDDPKNNRKQVFNNMKLMAEQNLSLLNLITNNININKQNDLIFLNNLKETITEFTELTENKFLKFLKQNNLYIEPRTILIRSEEKFINKNGEQLIKNEDYTYEYISPKEIFEKVLNDDYILEEIIKTIEHYACVNDDHDIESILQTKEWKQRVLDQQQNETENVLYVPIAGYSDDIDPQNTLGSHGGSYKIGLFYLFILSLPNNLKAKLDYYFLVQMYFSGDQKAFGNDILFKQLNGDLKYLRETGLPIQHKKYTRVKFLFVMLTGDNLGLHDLLEFSTSFNSNIVCRFCYMPKKERQRATIQQDHYMRNKYTQVTDENSNNISTTGVSKKSVFASNINVTQNFFVDLMHDFLLGTAKYDLAFSLHQIIKDKNEKLDINVLNNSVRNFDYGSNKSNIIDSFTEEKLKNGVIKASASEMMTLILFLPIIIGDFVTRDNKYFKFILHVKELLIIFCQRSYNKHLHVHAKIVISSHLQMFVELFGECLKYKHHILLHYHIIMYKSGPLVNFWCMRTESKNAIMKQIATVNNNRINLIKTITLRHQLAFSSFLCKDKTTSDFEFFIINSITHTQIEQEFGIIFPFINCKLQFMKKFKYLGNFFETKNIIITGLTIDESPIFAKILKIILMNETDLILIVKTLQLDFFDKHYAAYRLFESNFEATNYVLFSEIPKDPVAYNLIYKNNSMYVNYY